MVTSNIYLRLFMVIAIQTDAILQSIIYMVYLELAHNTSTV